MNAILETFKKHLGGLDNVVEDAVLDDVPRTKVQSYRFGDGIKAVNEFVGCIQIINSRLNKLQLIVSKIEFSREDIGEEDVSDATVNVSEILVSQAKELIKSTKFADKELFNCEMSVVMGTFDVNFHIEDPSQMLDSRDLSELSEYIASKQDEIKACLEVVRALTESNEGRVGADGFRGKTVGEALHFASAIKGE